MTNRHTLRFSIFAAAALALCLPVLAAAQSGGYPNDRALDHSRVNGTRREDQINAVAHDFRRAVSDLKSRVGNGRGLNRSYNYEPRRIPKGDVAMRACSPEITRRD